MTLWVSTEQYCTSGLERMPWSSDLSAFGNLIENTIDFCAVFLLCCSCCGGLFGFFPSAAKRVNSGSLDNFKELAILKAI